MLRQVTRSGFLIGLITALALCAAALAGGAFDIVTRQAIAVLVWTVIGVGWASGWLPRARIPAPVLVALAGCSMLCIVCAASFGWTESPARTLADLTRDGLYLGVLLLTASLVRGGAASCTVLGCLAAASAVMVVALVSRLLPSAFPEDEVGRVFETARLAYPVNYWNALGTLGAMTLAMGLGVSAHASERWLRFPALAAAPIASAVIFLTYSRGTVLGAAVAVLVALVAARHRVTTWLHLAVALVTSAAVVVAFRANREIADRTGTDGAGTIALVVIVSAVAAGAVAATTRPLDRLRVPSRVSRPALAVGLTAALAAAAFAGPSVASDAWSAFTQRSTTDTTDPVARLGTLSGYRYEIFRSALSAFEAHPLTGVGSGGFEFWFNRHGGVPQLRDAHSFVLEPMAELGTPGLIATLILVGGLIAGSIAARRAATDPLHLAAAVAGLAALAVWVVQASVDWIWESTAVTLIALTAAAAAAMTAARVGTRPPRWTRPVIALLAVAMTLVALPGISSTRHLRQSEAAGREGDAATAGDEAEAAVKAEPWSSEAWAQLAVVRESEERLGRAAVALDRAIELEPTNWRWPYLQARVLARLGRTEASRASLARARTLRPASPFLAAP